MYTRVQGVCGKLGLAYVQGVCGKLGLIYDTVGPRCAQLDVHRLDISDGSTDG